MGTRAEKGVKAFLGVLAFSLLFPSVLTFGYYVALSREPRPVVQAFYVLGKLVQFGLPLLFVRRAPGLRKRPSPRRGGGVALGLAFGILVWSAAMAVHRGLLWPLGLYGPAAEAVRAKVVSFGLGSPARFAAAGVFYAVVHSGLEEYYWRFFVFGELRLVLAKGPAILLSSLGFMAHHVIILATFLGWGSPFTYCAAAAVAVGGAFWAWLYDRTGSLLGPWLGHLLVDAAIFMVGFDLAGFGGG